MTETLKKLERRLAYRFTNPGLAELALTHRSFGKQNNERLEFLGDSIVNFIIAEALYAQFPNAKEGQLSRLRASLVNGSTLAALARDFTLGEHLNLGTGELKSGGFRRDSILADALEAIIGAIYLDAGFDHCKQVVLGWFSQRLQGLNLTSVSKDAKSKLQELLQANQLELPTYDILKQEGEAHNQTFTVRCRVEQLPMESVGHGASRRGAEQEAAQSLLTQLDQQAQLLRRPKTKP